MGTRTAGDFKKYSKIRKNSPKIKKLEDVLIKNESAKMVVNEVIGILSVSHPLGAIVLSAQVAYALYEGLKEYYKTENVSASIKRSGEDFTKIFFNNFMPPTISNVVGILAPVILKKLDLNKTEANEVTKIIKNAGTAAGEIL